jgi:hypothetical protein
VLSPIQLRLLAIECHGAPLPVRRATRVIWPNRVDPLTASPRVSAARSITRLLERDLATHSMTGGVLALTHRDRRLLKGRRELIAEVLAATS